MTIDGLIRTLPFGAAGAVLGLLGCSNDFGQPCELPQTEEFRRACETVAPDPNAEERDTEVISESKASCAVKNFAGCATRVCLVYRGSEPFCSEPCTTKSDCEGSAECRPILGDTVTTSEDICQRTECYCVRAGDIDN